MKLAAIAGVGVSVLGFFIYLMSRVAAPQMELLYGDLEAGDSKAILDKLATEKIPFEIRKDGAEIWVPRERKGELRVRMAEDAMPSSGGRVAGFELFDKQDALGTTSFQQNINYVRAMEGELARTIRQGEERPGAYRHARPRGVFPRKHRTFGLGHYQNEGDGQTGTRSGVGHSARDRGGGAEVETHPYFHCG